jgi:hypothetical protein
MSNEPKLRGNAKRRSSPYPLGQIPPSLAVAIGKRIVHRLAVGQQDITGDDFGEIFAQSIDGTHRGKPLGIADVEWQSCAWSIKTVKDEFPFTQSRIRIISGRNNIRYSYGISNPDADTAATGKAVLDIWNGRVNESLNQFDDLRIFILIRNMSTLEFTLVEQEAVRYISSEYRWEKNKSDNFEGFDIHHNIHRFTWQGTSQFTVLHHVPASAYRFRISHKPPTLAMQQVLRLSRFEESWIEPIAGPTHPQPGQILTLPLGGV